MRVDHPRRVRSFVRRPGRITTGQQRALDELLPRWGIPFSAHRVAPGEVFGRDTRRVLDIGFGDGEALLSAAARYPDIDYLGIEVHEPGIGHLLTLIERAGLTNIRICDCDAVDVIEQMLPEASFDAVNLLFPDPWPKKRHHKRRIVQAAFLDLVAAGLQPGGTLHIATDWANYAEHIDDALDAHPAFECAERREHGGDRALERPQTKFERRGLRRGHRIVDWRFVRTD